MRDSYNSGHTQLCVGWEVRGVCRNFTVGERSENITGVHKLAAREIENTHAVFHFAYRLRVYNISRAVVARDVQGQVIRRGENRLHIVNSLNAAYFAPALSVEAHDSHAEVTRRFGNKIAYRTHADNAHGLAFYLRTRKRALALFDELADIVALAFEGLAPVDSIYDFARSEKSRADNKLFYRVCIRSGRVEYCDALLRAPVDRDIIHTRSRASDCQKTRSELHLMHRSRAHHYRRRIFRIVGADIFCAVKAVGSALCYFI